MNLNLPVWLTALERLAALAAFYAATRHTVAVWRRGDFAIFDGPITRARHPLRFHSTLSAITGLLLLMMIATAKDLAVDIFRIWTDLHHGL